MLNWKPVEFFHAECNMTHSVMSENDTAKSILNSYSAAMLGLLK